MFARSCEILARTPLNTPRVSVGLPVYNGEKYLEGAIRSILDQTYRDFELIISDNASTDGTEAICRRFAAQDHRVRYHRNATNIGAAPNHNRTFELATGEFFKWAAHDDLYAKEMLQRCVEAFDRAPASVSVVYTQFELIDGEGRSLGIGSDPVESRDRRPYVRLARLLRWIGYHSATYGLFRSSTFRQTGLHPSFPYSDRVYLAELAMLGEFWQVHEPLVQLRHHPGRSVQANSSPDAIRRWFDPVEARKMRVLPLRTRASLEVARSALGLSLPWTDRVLCVAAAVGIPCWSGLLEWSFPIRKLIGLTPSVRRMKPSGHICRSA